MKQNLAKVLSIVLLALTTSCGNSVTNVWDYYVKNNVEVHKENGVTTSRTKMLLRENESVNKSQLEFIAYQQDSAKYLVIGSHKVAKNFYIDDSLYSFDVTNLYSRVRGNDFIRQMGDLSIFFTHIPAASVDRFLAEWVNIQATYKTTVPGEDQTVYVDYALSGSVYLSFPKTGKKGTPSDCTVWVGRRKHEISVSDLLKVMNDFKAFN